MRVLLFFAALLSLAACGGAAEVCSTSQCRQDAVIAAWLADPDQGALSLEALPDEIERSAAVVRIIEIDPSGVSQLCDQLPQGKLRVRCQRTSDRPHLWEDPSRAAVNGSQGGSGSHTHRLTPGQHRVSEYQFVPGDLGMCANAPDPHTCAWARAMEMGERGKVRDAAVRCAGIEVEDGESALWQAECRFSAAEATIKGQGSAGYAGAAELCMSSDRFRERCLIHLSRELAAKTPPADCAPGPALKATVESAQAIGRFWGSDAAANKFVDHFWSLAIGYAFLRADTVTGDIIDGVPETVLPHIHAAAAWRLIQLDAAQARTLAQWAEALDTHLKARAGLPARPIQAVHMPGVGNLWPAGKDDGSRITAVIYMGMGSRGRSDEVQEDRLICLLEAAARQDPLMETLLSEGAGHSSGVVNWTAVRLQGALAQSVRIKSQPGN